ncbi:hypothetical protein SAMN02745165_02226 [Malonomonas rubra DSM 5091]|uniref:DUF2157 domain-containing protein n=1 Tax=Malonomonas rubra DSM 5091 TaxID=1122189 RepID=A0A1M6ISI6_MALRU|nr:hypothetical protein [Malonomonas rubra]SHJ37347.1 hypothetical protein SAMN02745165_02226 [Malonomonas rubra DSM 5091]
MNNQSGPDFIFEVEDEKAKPQDTFRLTDTKTISRILRSLGAIIIVASASTFLFQHWTPGSDLQRFLLLLGFTAILSLGGLFCGLRLQESKGARTLLGLTLAVTPINFSIMGALLFSQFSWDGSFAQLPGYATWVASSPGMALLMALGGIAVLAPLGHFSFMTLGHNRAKLLSVTFLISNLTLLLPTRQPNAIAAVFMLLIAALTFNEISAFRKETSLRTFEGILSRTALWIPAAILIGRGCYFYTPNQLFVSAILIAVAALFFVILPQFTGRASWQRASQIFGAIVASVAWLNLAELLDRSWRIGSDWELLLAIMPISGILYLLSRFSLCSGRNYRRAAAIVAILGGSANLLFHSGLQAALFCLLISISVLVYGYLCEQKIIFFSGALGTLFGLGYQVKAALHHFSLAGWSSLMVIGVAIIISASFLERNGGRLRARVQHVRTRLNQWER